MESINGLPNFPLQQTDEGSAALRPEEVRIQEAIEGRLYLQPTVVVPLAESMKILGEQLGECAALTLDELADVPHYFGDVPDANLFGAIHEEYLLKGSGLEGSAPKQTLAILSAYFRGRDERLYRKYTDALELCDEMSSLQPAKSTADLVANLVDDVQHIRGRLALLTPGQSLLLPIGWAAKVGSGHAM